MHACKELYKEVLLLLLYYSQLVRIKKWSEQQTLFINICANWKNKRISITTRKMTSIVYYDVKWTIPENNKSTDILCGYNNVEQYNCHTYE